MEGPRLGKVERAKCWDTLLADEELAVLMGKSNASRGKALLKSIKTAKALDVSGDGFIASDELQRLYDPAVLSAADFDVALRSKVKSLWKQAGGAHRLERPECWKLLLGDEELAGLMGKSNRAKGKAMLEAMQAARALDVSGDGFVSQDEFQRLYKQSVLAAAEADVALRFKIEGLWRALGGATGGIERLGCWDILLADDELAMLVGKGELRRGKAVLEAMKAAKALDVSGDGSITQEEFKRLYDPAVLAAADAKVPKEPVKAAPEAASPELEAKLSAVQAENATLRQGLVSLSVLQEQVHLSLVRSSFLVPSLDDGSSMMVGRCALRARFLLRRCGRFRRSYSVAKKH